jgi:hypothetical protein
VDDNLLPHRDQWAFLSSLSRLAPQAVLDFIREAEARDRVLAVRIPVAEENGDDPWRQAPSLRHSPERVTVPLPDRVKIVLSDDIYIDRTALPPSMVALLIRLAVFKNPEFYRAQAMRLPTFGKPRIISCASLHRQYDGRVFVPCASYEIKWVSASSFAPSLRLRDDCGMVLTAKYLFIFRRPASQDNEWPASSAIEVQSEMTHPAVARRQYCMGIAWR